MDTLWIAVQVCAVVATFLWLSILLMGLVVDGELYDVVEVALFSVKLTAALAIFSGGVTVAACLISWIIGR